MTKQRAMIATVECIKGVLEGVEEKRDDTTISLEAHYDVTSKWLSDTFQLCKMKFGDVTKEESIPKNAVKTGSTQNENTNPNLIISDKSCRATNKVSATLAVHNEVPKVSTEKELVVMAMKVEELKRELKSRGLSTTGIKRILRNRLLEALEKERSTRDEPIADKESTIRENKRKRSMSPQAIVSKPKKDTGKISPISSGLLQSKSRSGPPASDNAVDVEMKDTSESDASRGAVSEMEVDSESKQEDMGVTSNESASCAISTSKVESSCSAASACRDGDNQKGRAHENKTEHSNSIAKEGKSEALLHEKSALNKVQVSSSSTAVGSSLKSVGRPNETNVKGLDETSKKDRSSGGGTENAVNSRESAETNDERSSDEKGVRMLSNPAVSLANGANKSSGETTTKKAKEYSEIWKARLAEMRGKSKAMATKDVNGSAKNIPSVSKLVLKATISSVETEADKRKKQLAAQMREKTAAMSQQKNTEIENKKTEFPSSIAQIQTSTSHKNAQAAAIKSHAPTTSGSQPKRVIESKIDVVKSTKVTQETDKDEIRSPMDTYEISDREESDSESDEDSYDEAKQKKKVPMWAQRSNLVKALENQYFGKPRLDPDEIFGEVHTCNLEAIFDQKKSKYSKRTSSGNWTKDQATAAEKLAYKRQMGFSGK